MIESGMRGSVCHVICSYAEANSKYMNNYDKSKESSFLSYLDANNLSRIDEEFIKTYDKNSDTGYFHKVELEYPKELHDLHSNLPFLPEKMEINKHEKLVCALYDK